MFTARHRTPPKIATSTVLVLFTSRGSLYTSRGHRSTLFVVVPCRIFRYTVVTGELFGHINLSFYALCPNHCHLNFDILWSYIDNFRSFADIFISDLITP